MNRLKRRDPARADTELGPRRGMVPSGLLVILCASVGPVPSGGDRLIIELVRRAPAEIGPITILTTADCRSYLDELAGRNVGVSMLDLRSWPQSKVARAQILRVIKAPVFVNRLIRALRPRIVFSASPFMPDLTAALVGRAMGTKWIHSWQLDIPPPWIGYEHANQDRREPLHVRGSRLWLERNAGFAYVSQRLSLLAAKHWANVLIVPNDKMARAASAFGISSTRILATRYGINLGEVAEGMAMSGDGKPKYDAVFVGRFHAQKGLTDLIHVWRAVIDVIPGARLAVIGDGDGPRAAEFKASLRSLGDAVVYLGVLTGVQKYSVMANAKVFVFPSHHESWGHVVNEAMASGLAVVGYKLPSSVEAFNGAILTVPTGDVDALARAVVELLQDEDLRRRYAKLGRQWAESRTWKSIASDFWGRVENLIG